MAKYYKVEINKNLVKKLFKKDIEEFNIDLKKSLTDNFLGIHTNYTTLRNDLKGTNLTQEEIDFKVSKSQLLFYITNGNWISESNELQELPLLKIGEYLLTDKIEEGFSVYLKQMIDGDKDYYTFYTKDDLSIIKKVLGSKAILEEIEIDDSNYKKNEVKALINWENMLKLQEQTEGGDGVTWGQKEIDKKREIILNTFLTNTISEAELNYVDDLKKKDEELYLDMVYDIVFKNVNSPNSEDKKVLRLREPQYFQTILKKLFNTDSYKKFDADVVLMFGLNYMHDIGLDTLELRAKFLNKAYAKISENEENNTTGLTKDDILTELYAFAKLSKVFSIFNEFEPVTINKKNLSLQIQLIKFINFENEMEKILDDFGVIEITKKEKEMDENQNQYVNLTFENMILKERKELKLLRENALVEIIKENPLREEKLIPLDKITIDDLKDGKKWVNYAGLYEYPSNRREKLVLALNYLNEKFSAKNINYSLIRNIFLEIKQDKSMRDDLINFMFASTFEINKGNIPLGMFEKIERVKKELELEMSDERIFQILNRLGSYSYVSETYDKYMNALEILEGIDIKRGLNIFYNQDLDDNLNRAFHEKIFFQKDKLLALAFNKNSKISFEEADMLVERNLLDFKKFLEVSEDGTGFKKEHKTLLQTFIEGDNYYSKNKELAKKMYEKMLALGVNDNEFAKKIMVSLIKPATVDNDLMNIISEEIGAAHLFYRDNDWGQLASKKLYMKGEDVKQRLQLAHKFFDKKYDLFLPNETRAKLLIRAIKLTTTNIPHDKEDVANFKIFFESLKETHPEIRKEVVAALANEDALSKKRVVDVFNQLDVMKDIEEHILNKNDLMFMCKYVSENKINNFFDSNPEKLKELKVKALGSENQKFHDAMLRKLMVLGYIRDFEYDDSLINHLKNNGKYESFPKYGFEVYNRNLLKKHAGWLSEIITNNQDGASQYERIQSLQSLIKGFSKEIQKEDQTIEIVASLLRTINETTQEDIYTKFKGDITNIYKLFGEQKYGVIASLLEQKNESLESILSKIKFANLGKNDVVKARTKI